MRVRPWLGVRGEKKTGRARGSMGDRRRPSLSPTNQLDRAGEAGEHGLFS